MQNQRRKICLMGAGYIADTHAEAIRSNPALELASVVEIRTAIGEAFARRHACEEVFFHPEEAIAKQKIDAVHILVPPDKHKEAAAPWLSAGIPVLMEKPLATSAAESDELIKWEREGGTCLGVNQNFVFHPSFRRLQNTVNSRQLGSLESLSCTYSMPLRHLQTGQFGHWMFREPKNILLEQAVHPLSQLAALAGQRIRFSGLARRARELVAGAMFYDKLDLLIDYQRCSAHLRFAVGNPYPVWAMTAICSDGIAVADMIANRLQVYSSSKWLEAADHATAGINGAKQLLIESAGNFLNYGRSMLGVGQRSDAFFVSMKESIADFHNACSERRLPECSSAFGAQLVSFCEEISDRLFDKSSRRSLSPQAKTSVSPYDVAVLGGTGFIGRELIRQLTESGRSVGVLARSTINLPAVFSEDGVTLVRGDVGSTDDIRRAIGDAKTVINLAHGGGGSNWADIERTMVGSARNVAEVCIEKKMNRLIHVGSIAGLYLGDENAVITNDTGPDPQPELRADYARGKAVTDELLLEYHRTKGLNVTIVRPGIVVGLGTPPLHSGVGFFNSEPHCLGWNAGDNPLPFVLVEDVAAAIIKAIDAPGIQGRCLNVVGEVRLTAQDYIAELAAALGRPLRYHSQSPYKLLLIEWMKWTAKRVGGRKIPAPSLRDFKSRGLVSRFDCSDTHTALGWMPVLSRETFIDRAISVHTAGAS